MSKTAGFTLMELLAVVLIITVLAAAALPQYEKAVLKAQAAEGVSVMKSLSPAVEEYILANGKTPSSFDELSLRPAGTVKNPAGGINGQYLRFVLQDERLQSWDLKTETWGFIWYPGMEHPGISGRKFYCFVLRGSDADGKKVCVLAGGKEKITSPTNSGFDWYALD